MWMKNLSHRKKKNTRLGNFPIVIAIARQSRVETTLAEFWSLYTQPGCITALLRNQTSLIRCGTLSLVMGKHRSPDSRCLVLASSLTPVWHKNSHSQGLSPKHPWRLVLPGLGFCTRVPHKASSTGIVNMGHGKAPQRLAVQKLRRQRITHTCYNPPFRIL